MKYKSFALQALLIAFIFLVPHLAFTQVYSNKEVGKKNLQRIDSMKNTEYPYILPLLGKQATKKGFSLPYSAGIGINYLWQKSDLVINNLQVGFNNNPPQNMDQVIRFNNATSEAVGLNIRPDVWLLPFLNVYAIFAKSNPSTSVDFGIYAPDGGGNWNNIINLNTKANFQATTFGLGVTPTIGIGGGWMALDMNFTWNDIPELDKPAFAFVLGPRFGKTFRLKAPEKSVAIWAGGFRLHLNSGTSGSIPLTQFIDTNGLQEKVDAGIAKVDASQQQVESWWGGLSSIEQKNPVNVAKYETANRALGAAGNFLNGLDEALTDGQHASVQYSLDKRPKDMWNFIVGGQYQHNKHWMVRAEFGFLGSRQQIITGLQYRFGL